MGNINLKLKNSNITKKMINEYAKKVKLIHDDLHKRGNLEKDDRRGGYIRTRIP